SRPSYFWLCAGLTLGLNTSGFLDKKKSLEKKNVEYNKKYRQKKREELKNAKK
ncbi:unnamed protein product, partial [marine sediment metagenome]